MTSKIKGWLARGAVLAITGWLMQALAGGAVSVGCKIGWRPRGQS